MRLRLILSFAVVVLVAVSSVVLLTRQGAVSEVRSFVFKGGMSGQGGIVSQLEEYYQVNASWDGVESVMHTPGQGRGKGNSNAGGAGMNLAGELITRVRLADVNGNLVSDSENTQPDGQLSSSEIDVAIPIQVGSETVGYLLQEGVTEFTLADEVFLLNRLNRAALISGLIAGGVSLLLALFLAYRLLRPVRELTQTAQSLGTGDLSARVDVEGSDELALLGSTFNHMAASLQQSEESRRAMTSDIAHELRTPLAVQRANLEALQDGVYPLSIENLSPIIEQNFLLTRLVDDLHTLALVDAGQLQLETSKIDVLHLTERVVERFRPQASSRGIELEFVRIGAENTFPEIYADPFRIEQILHNLLSNALRHTLDDGKTIVQIEPVAQTVQISVLDSGSGIPEDSISFIFERFYRADRSRSRLKGGTGLGLAIARQLADAHGGTLTAGNQVDGGAVFTLSLPVPEKK